jgi:hypothetical protein
MDFNFNCNEGFDQEFSDGMDFLADEDFGLAKSFTTAPIGLLAPGTSLKSAEATNVEKECEERMANEIKADGFCFKLHPSED